MDQGDSNSSTRQRVAIIGAGPVGLEAALEAHRRGYAVRIFERGEVADHIRQWGHVRLFSPFQMNRSELAVEMLRGASVTPPADDTFLTGAEYVEQFLLPLSQLEPLASSLQTQTRVLALGRERLLKGDLIGGAREAHPFRILVERGGVERIETADILLDCSGCWSRPNALGDGGVPAPGERAAADQIDYHLPNLDALQSDYSGRRLLIVGAGYSAATALELLLSGTGQSSDRPASISWAWRGADEAPFKELGDDPLPERGRLARMANEIARGGDETVRPLPGRSVERIDATSAGALRVTFAGEATSIEVDRILAMVGFSPDRSLYEKLQVHECWATLGPIKLAATLLSAGATDCLAQQVAGFDSLTHPEPGFFILGAKSYGTNSSFLIRLGLEQVQELFTGLDATSASRSL